MMKDAANQQSKKREGKYCSLALTSFKDSVLTLLELSIDTTLEMRLTLVIVQEWNGKKMLSD